MIDPQARLATYIKLILFVAVLGLISALITFAFVALVHQGTHLLWEQAAAATMAGALVVALKAPLFAALFTSALVQKETGAVIAVAVAVSALLTALLALRAADQPQAYPATS